MYLSDTLTEIIVLLLSFSVHVLHIFSPISSQTGFRFAHDFTQPSTHVTNG